MRAIVFVLALTILPMPAIAKNADPQIWSGVFSTTQAERGRTVFVTHCRAPRYGGQAIDDGRWTIDDGRSTFQLLSPYPNPTPHAGRKVQVKGLLSRNPSGDRINVMALEPVDDSCAP